MNWSSAEKLIMHLSWGVHDYPKRSACCFEGMCRSDISWHLCCAVTDTITYWTKSFPVISIFRSSVNDSCLELGSWRWDFVKILLQAANSMWGVMTLTDVICSRSGIFWLQKCRISPVWRCCFEMQKHFPVWYYSNVHAIVLCSTGDSIAFPPSCPTRRSLFYIAFIHICVM